MSENTNPENSNISSAISREQYNALISNHPYLKLLSGSEVSELAELAFEKHFAINKTIVTQGELIDCVYLIAKGEVEVACEIEISGKKELSPQAILREGEAIGLGISDFFSQTGVRTATLTTLSETILIGWTLADFDKFLQVHASFKGSMQRIAKQMLRINFIKQITPFEDLSHTQVAWLAQQVEHVTLPPDTIIFQEGDVGDKCYLVQFGKVEILTHKNGAEKTLAILEPPMLFGETALLTASPRNAMARVCEKAELLAIRAEHLHTLFKSNANAAESMMILMIERSRPIQRLDITAHHRHTPEGHAIVILKDHHRGRYFQLSQQGWFIWQQLDGKQTLQDISIALFKSQRIFAPEAVADTILNLAEAGFVKLDTMIAYHQEKFSYKTYMLGILKKLTFIHIRIRNIDKSITSLYELGIDWLFSPIGQFIMAGLLTIGFIFFVLSPNISLNSFKSINHPLIILTILVFSNLLEVVLHEAAHAFATKAQKHEVHGAEIIISWFGFVAFVDTSDMWLSNRRSRIIVNLAGVYVDLVVAGIAGIIAYFITQPELVMFFWLFTLTLYYGVFKNLNPLYENDGYYVLRDMLNDSKLRINAFNWLAQAHIAKASRSILIYWCICGIFFVVAILFALFLQYYLRLILPSSLLGISTWHLIWILPVLVIVNFTANIIIPLRKLTNHRNNDSK